MQTQKHIQKHRKKQENQQKQSYTRRIVFELLESLYHWISLAHLHQQLHKQQQIHNQTVDRSPIYTDLKVKIEGET